MKSFPMFIRTTDRRIVIVGGGEQAAQKARLLLKTDARLVLVAPELDPELAGIVAAGRATQETRLGAATFEGTVMAFIATGCPALDHAAQALARASGCLVNVVDRPELCDLTTPALVDRDPVVIAIGSEGTAPVLTREIKTALEVMLPPGLGALAALAGRLRPAVAQSVPREERRRFWTWVFSSAPRAAWNRGAEREAAALIKEAIREGRAPGTEAPQLTLVDGTVAAPDLLSLRAVKRLQDADLLFCDPGTHPGIPELARRDATRVVLKSDSPFPGGGLAALRASLRPGLSAVWIAGAESLAGGADLSVAAQVLRIEDLARPVPIPGPIPVPIPGPTGPCGPGGVQGLTVQAAAVARLA